MVRYPDSALEIMCRPCRAKRQKSRGGDTRGPERICPVCDKPFCPCKTSRTEDGWTEVCSQLCEQQRRLSLAGLGDFAARAARKAQTNRAKMARKHAIRRAAFVEKVDRLVVFERDGWICYLCGEPVDKTLTGRDPMAPSIDHIIPLSRGGLDCYDNVALAHYSCNCRKWVHLEAGDHADVQPAPALQESGL